MPGKEHEPHNKNIASPTKATISRRSPASSACMFTPDGFKPAGFNKYNGKTRPQQ